MSHNLEQHPERPHAEYTESRRRVLIGLSVFLTGVIAVALGYPVAGFILEPMFEREPGVWRSVGRVTDFVIGDTVLVTFENANPLPWGGFLANSAAWLRRVSAGDFICFSINCTHLLCPVRWEPTSTLFFCPCHGGVYYQDGTVAAGPPPNPLPRYPVRVRNGAVEVRTSPLPSTESTSPLIRNP